MSEPVTKAVAQEQPVQKIRTRTSVGRLAWIASVATAGAVFAVLVAAVVYAQDRNVDHFEIVVELSFRKNLDTLIVRRGGAHHRQRLTERSSSARSH